MAADVGADLGVVFHDEDRRHVGGVQRLLDGGLQQVYVGPSVPVRAVEAQRRPVARRQRRGGPIDLIRREVRPPEGEREGEGAPEAHLARDRQRAPVQIHDLLRQRQPDARAQLRLRRLVDLIEPVEDVGQLRRRDARAAVADGHARRAARGNVARGLDAHPNGPGLWRELDRVGEEVVDGLLKLLGVGEDLDRHARAADLERQRLPRRHRLERLRDAFDERAEVERAGVERRPPGFEAGHVEDLVDEVEHAAGVAAREVDLLGHRRRQRPVEARLEVVERTERQRERRPELVADVREEGALGRVERLQAPRLRGDGLLLGPELLGPLLDDGFELPLPRRQRPLARAEPEPQRRQKPQPAQRGEPPGLVEERRHHERRLDGLAPHPAPVPGLDPERVGPGVESAVADGPGLALVLPRVLEADELGPEADEVGRRQVEGRVVHLGRAVPARQAEAGPACRQRPLPGVGPDGLDEHGGRLGELASVGGRVDRA